MGMDAYIYRVHNRKEIEDPNFYSKCITVEDKAGWDEDDMTKPAELWYARKFWGLHETIFGDDYECGEYIEIDKDTIEKMLDFATHNPDYFGGFVGVESLCWILQYYDKMKSNGFILVYEADW